MKIFYMALGLMLHSMAAQATILPKEEPQETKLYNFSEELISAVENCSEYNAEFSLKDTPYAHLGDFAGDMPSKSKFEIYYKDKNMCRMRVRLIALGHGETRFNCRFNDEQRALLAQAMRDKSTEEYVITLPTTDEEDCSGCSSAVTFSGNLFDTTLAMLKPKACAELHIMPTTDELEAARVYKKRFSDDFRNMLLKCTPAKGEDANKNRLDGIEIFGLTEDKKCHLKYADFEMEVEPRQFYSIYSVDDLHRFLLRNLDDAKYDYESKYDGEGILFGLDACRKEGGFYDAGENIFMHGNIQARNGLTARLSDDTCHIVLKNSLEIADIYHRDYTLQCNVPVAQISPLTKLYSYLLEESGEQVEQDKNGVFYATEVQYTPEIQKADKELLAKVREFGYCHKKLPIDPIKIERENFTYSNSLPTK